MPHFILHVDGDRSAFGKRKVAAVPAMFAGQIGADGRIYKPDFFEVEQALPYLWRRAYGRSNGAFWFDREGKAPGYLELRDVRGALITTLRATLAE